MFQIKGFRQNTFWKGPRLSYVGRLLYGHYDSMSWQLYTCKNGDVFENILNYYFATFKRLTFRSSPLEYLALLVVI